MADVPEPATLLLENPQQNHYLDLFRSTTAFDMQNTNSQLHATAKVDEHNNSSKIVSLAKSYLQIQNNLRVEEARSIENTLTFLMQNTEFESLNAREKALILTRKVCSIREDYTQMQQMIKEHSGLLMSEKTATDGVAAATTNLP